MDFRERENGGLTQGLEYDLATFNTILALLFVTGATVLLLRSVWHLLTALESRSWPTTQGIVMASKL